MKNIRHKGNLILILLAILTVISAVIKVQMEIDNDEMYVVTMGIRLLNGDRIFADMWELHMTSAWPAYLGLLLLRTVTGSLDGAVIFLRILSVIAQFAVSIAAYIILKRWNDRTPAALAALTIANFLPRASQNLEYGLLEMLFIVIAVVLLYDVVKRNGQSYKDRRTGDVTINGNSTRVGDYAEIIIAGVFYALGVLAYPTVILSFPVILVGLYLLLRRLRLPVIFAVTCAVCALIFIIYVLSYMTPQEFAAAVNGMLMDGAHTGEYRLEANASQLITVAKRSTLIIIAAAVIYAVYITAKNTVIKRRVNKEACDKMSPVSGIISATLLSGALIMIVPNITGLRPSSPIGLQVRYIIVALAASYFVIKKKDSELLWLFLLPGLAIYAGVMAGSNMGFEENAAYLYLAAVALVLAYTSHNKAWFTACTSIFILSLIFCRGYLVRITNTEPANITETRIRIEGGALAGIMVYPEEAESLSAKEENIREYTDESDVMLYLGDQALCNTFTDGRFTSATCISTPVFNEEWVDYYEDESHEQPTVIFVDRDNQDTWEEFTGTAFGEYLADRYELKETDATITDKFMILTLEQ
jgi:hypothetical protein